ncbi:hypothetical protein AC579_7074 [Pseudocercospora musae]|uniref:Uncharacterized protein n=1 Tax=Pseudocercospora musae TaxID=113226 RepID=A0A139I5S9_9PEZI|nr:hypothetical protein AC579_7074 [Pseudocercospora musae]
MTDRRTRDPALIQSALCFYPEPADGDDPVYVTAGPKSIGVRNYAHHKVNVPIRDLRRLEAHFSLEQHSFVALPKVFNDAIVVDFEDQADINARYLPMAQEFLLDRVPGAKEVFVFGTMIREASHVKTANRQVNKIHVDQSAEGAYFRAQRHLHRTQFDAVISGQSRLRIINVWKPAHRRESSGPSACLC